MPVIATQQHVATITSKGVTSSALSATSVQTTIQAEGVGIIRIIETDKSSGVIPVIAGEQISALRAIKVIDDKAYVCDSSNVEDADLCIGISVTAANQGESLAVQTSGIMEDSSWNFIAGQPIYFNAEGRLEQTVPLENFSQIIGYSITESKLKIEVQQALYY